jgi:CRP-like cAMP-binding protein
VPVPLAALPHEASGARLRRSGEHARCRNALLQALPAETLADLVPLLERVPLKKRQVLQERNLPLTHAYFIESGAASLVTRAGDKTAVEIGTLGRSDLVGLPLVLGTARSPHRCIVQVPGEALRIGADDFAKMAQRLTGLRSVLLAYVQAAMVHSAQLAACNSHHSLQQRLARWLLAVHDQLDGGDVPVTHQCLSRALGVRRAGVTTVVGRMESDGLLRRGRGMLAVVDRNGLEGVACDCYRAVRSEHQRIACEPAHGPGANVLPLRRSHGSC